jgi:hypothetical protein
VEGSLHGGRELDTAPENAGRKLGASYFSSWRTCEVRQGCATLRSNTETGKLELRIFSEMEGFLARIRAEVDTRPQEATEVGVFFSRWRGSLHVKG